MSEKKRKFPGHKGSDQEKDKDKEKKQGSSRDNQGDDKDKGEEYNSPEEKRLKGIRREKRVAESRESGESSPISLAGGEETSSTSSSVGGSRPDGVSMLASVLKHTEGLQICDEEVAVTEDLDLFGKLMKSFLGIKFGAMCTNCTCIVNQRKLTSVTPIVASDETPLLTGERRQYTGLELTWKELDGNVSTYNLPVTDQPSDQNKEIKKQGETGSGSESDCPKFLKRRVEQPSTSSGLPGFGFLHLRQSSDDTTTDSSLGPPLPVNDPEAMCRLSSAESETRALSSDDPSDIKDLRKTLKVKGVGKSEVYASPASGNDTDQDVGIDQLDNIGGPEGNQQDNNNMGLANVPSLDNRNVIMRSESETTTESKDTTITITDENQQTEVRVLTEKDALVTDPAFPGGLSPIGDRTSDSSTSMHVHRENISDQSMITDEERGLPTGSSGSQLSPREGPDGPSGDISPHSSMMEHSATFSEDTSAAEPILGPSRRLRARQFQRGDTLETVNSEEFDDDRSNLSDLDDEHSAASGGVLPRSDGS